MAGKVDHADCSFEDFDGSLEFHALLMAQHVALVRVIVTYEEY